MTATDPSSTETGDQHPGQQNYQGYCTKAGQCLMNMECPLFGPCTKAKALGKPGAYDATVEHMRRWAAGEETHPGEEDEDPEE